MGLPASGKTTLAQALVGRLGLVHISSDVVRKELAHLAPGEPRREAFGEGLLCANDDAAQVRGAHVAR